jgi:hypothetical protein
MRQVYGSYKVVAPIPWRVRLRYIRKRAIHGTIGWLLDVGA